MITDAGLPENGVDVKASTMVYKRVGLDIVEASSSQLRGMTSLEGGCGVIVVLSRRTQGGRVAL